MRARKVVSPDGREWTVTISRVRLPPWRESDEDGLASADDLGAGGLIVDLVVWLVSVVLVPLLRFVVELPVALVRGLLSQHRWVEAETTWPSELRLVWRTTRAEAREVADHVAATLEHGYVGLTHPRAEELPTPRPPWLQHSD